MDIMSVSAVVGSELDIVENVGVVVKELRDVVGMKDSDSVGLPVGKASSIIGDDVGEILTRLVQYKLSNTDATSSSSPFGGVFK